MEETTIDKNIAQAAQEAVAVISKAAETAAKVVANATSEAVKVVNAKGEGDHDVLIEIKTQVIRLIKDVADINNNLAAKVENLEDCKAEKTDIATLHGETLIRLEKLDNKVSALEQYRYYLAGGLFVLLFAIDYIVKKYL